MKLSQELRDRGLVQHHTFKDLEWLDEPRTFYFGIDATSADSLTIGNLVPCLVARRLLDAGWKTILLVGGATSMIGDPGGKDVERSLVSREEIIKNIEGIKKQIKNLFVGKKFTLVDNYDWFKDIKYLDFLREVGKHFSMTELVQREYVRERMGEGGGGISYAEFSYSLIQGYDFWHLYRTMGAVMQLGGSDQWGNMVSGLPLIRKKEGAEAHALSTPLLISKVTGKKFGKSEEGTIWLDSKKTSPFKMYQFFFNSEDDSIEEYLLKLTLLPIEEIKEILTTHKQSTNLRFAQKKLAFEVVKIVHGEESARRTERVSEILFGENGSRQSIDANDWSLLKNEAPNIKVDVDMSLIDTLVLSKLVDSKREARQLLTEGAITLNYKREVDDRLLSRMDFPTNHALLQRGKRYVCILTLK